MRKYKIIPPNTLDTNGKPVIGSGRIKRRVIVIPYRMNNDKFIVKPTSSPSSPLQTKKSVFKFKQSNPTNPKTERLSFPDPDTRIIFYLWQRIGHPFIHHIEKKSKVTTTGIDLIRKHIRKYGKFEVINSIEKCHWLFNSLWFKYRLYFNAKKLSLPDFFSYPSDQYQKISQNKSDVPRSWFKLCNKWSKEKIRKEFEVVFKNEKYPEITKRIIRSWETYTREELTVSEQNSISRFVNRLVLWHKDKISADIDIITIADIIERMLNEFHTWKPKSISHLMSEIFLNDTLPNEISRYFGISKKEIYK
jgi:hypothetical protein